MGQPATGERSQTLAAVAAWGTAVDGAGAADGVREMVEEAVDEPSIDKLRAQDVVEGGGRLAAGGCWRGKEGERKGRERRR